MAEYKRPSSLKPMPTPYCPGCLHALATRLVADVIDAVRNRARKFKAPWTSSDKNVLIDYEDITSAMYVLAKPESTESFDDAVSQIFGTSLKIEYADDCAAFIAPADKIGIIKEKLSKIPAKICNTIMVME